MRGSIFQIDFQHSHEFSPPHLPAYIRYSYMQYNRSNRLDCSFIVESKISLWIWERTPLCCRAMGCCLEKYIQLMNIENCLRLYIIILNTSLQVCICGEGLCVVVIFRLIVAMRQADFCDRMLASHFQRFNIPPLFAHLANIRNENVDDICDVDDQLPCTLNSAKLEMPNAGLIFNTI